jgi:hypothetical protein
MRTTSRNGFNVVELAVVVFIAFMAMTMFFSAYNEGIMRSVSSSLAVRVKDLYVAITAANLEREAVGLPSLWTSALDQQTVSQMRVGPVPSAFSNSTDLFRCLIENGLCRGLTYASLAGGGVSGGERGAFSATNNIWSVAVNLRDELPDSLPHLITRNVDLLPLAAKMSQKDLGQRVRPDPEWQTPFGDRGFVCIRKGGAIFVWRRKSVAYRAVCGTEPYDPAVDQNGQRVSKPLTFLTPTRAIVPGGISP